MSISQGGSAQQLCAGVGGDEPVQPEPASIPARARFCRGPKPLREIRDLSCDPCAIAARPAS
jgi:hypothetical protein